MGQYHTIYNKTKKEYFNFGGAKLWEKAWDRVAHMALLTLLSNSNGRGGGDMNNPIHKDIWTKDMKTRKRPAYKLWNSDQKVTKKDYDAIEKAINEISGRWAGDEIVVQGDYAEKGDTAYIPDKQAEKYTDVTGLVVDAFKAVFQYDDDDNEMIADFKQEVSWFERRRA